MKNYTASIAVQNIDNIDSDSDVYSIQESQHIGTSHEVNGVLYESHNATSFPIIKNC